MKVKVATFQSRLQHSTEFNKEIAEFTAAIESALGDKLIYAPLEDYDCDIKLIFVQTGGSEGFFLQNFDKLREPYYLLTNGANNSLAASLEILTYLNSHGKKGEILHGGATYIANRIKQLAAVDLATKKLAAARLGVVGRPSDWLIASVPQYKQVADRLGVTLVDIPLEDVEKAATKLSPKSDMDKSDAIYQALKDIAARYNLNGLTIRCFDLLSSLKGTGCLALAKLNAEDVIGTCEGDVMAMISMLVANAVSGQSTFQANPSRLDTDNNTVVFAHCTAPLDMLTSYHYDTHFESGIGVAIKGELKTGRVTVLRMAEDLKRYYVTQGEILENLDESNLCRTQIRIKLDTPVEALLKTPCGNHHIIVYGEHADTIKSLLDTLL